MKNPTILTLILFFMTFLLTACGVNSNLPETSPPTSAPTNTIVPTPTEETYALSVNGKKISTEELANEIDRVKRAEEAAGIVRSEEDRRNFVIDELVGSLLLAEEATKNGFQLSESDYQNKIDDLVSQLGSQQALDIWIEQNGYTQESFREDLERSLAAAFTRDQLLAKVPVSSKQFHLQIMLLYDKPTAEYYYNQYLGGSDFNTLAAIIDPLTRGDIGWFPIGYLSDPVIEEAVVEMNVDEVIGIIEGKVGFYILKLLEIDNDRRLSPDALLQAQKKAIDDWLSQQLANSEVLINN